MILNLNETFANDYIIVEVNEELSYIQTTWQQHPSSKVYREHIKMVAEYVVRKKLSKWLCDIRKVAYTEIPDQNWLLRDIFLLFKDLKPFKFAYVVSTAGFELMDTYRIQEMVETNPDLNKQIIVETFLDKDMAQSWLLENNS